MAILVPANARATERSYGRGWECRYGFRQIEDACVAVKAPEHAFLDPSGDRWKCGRGFVQTG
ncbi:MAG: hypothetical protein EXQ97_03060 [Alphaproteobacteria bacterium]|nr:hypothetical protein [Alphaproteobacteria bacterium]